MKIAVFVSGRGSNLKAILESPDLKNIVSVEAVLSDKPDCKAFDIAEQFNIKSFSVGEGEGKIKVNQLPALLIELKIDMIVLAGYLKLIPVDLITNFENRIINIHPALLPSFGGKGMYGINVHKAVFNSSAKVSGATVHMVDNSYDTGRIIAQKCVDISDVKSPEEIAERVLEVEHKILPEVIKAFALNKVRFEASRIIIEKNNF
ncbi:MAG: phosphoribosylglycinamide formyltransferase [Ignavibacteriaceae bacterium]